MLADLLRCALFVSFLVIPTKCLTAHADDLLLQKVESGLLRTAAPQSGATATILEQMRNYGVPGISVAVIDNGRIAWAKGYGIADSRTGVPVTVETLFQAASISKPMAALAALSLVDDGSLDLDQNVNQYLKSYRIPENDFTRPQKVTLRMLLSHSSGVGEFEYRDSFAKGRTATLLEILDGKQPADNLPVVVTSVPDSGYAYSKAGYDILQQLLVDVSRQSFNDLMTSRVFRSLGMAHSTFKQQPGLSQFVVATGHSAGGDVQPAGPEIVELAAAGLWSTPSDLARYVLAIQKAKAGVANTALSSTLANEMLKPQKGFHGLGPVISGDGAGTRFGHDGFNRGFQASMVGYVDGDRGAVVMANSNLAFTLIVEILESIARVYEWPNYGRTNMWPPEAPLAQQIVTPVPSRLMDASEGKYVTESGESMSLLKKEGSLFLALPIEGEAEVFAANDGRLFCPSLLFSDLGSPWLTFEQDGHGSVKKIRAGYEAFATFNRAE
ncbi:MAG: serine hydrolase domain-containing protein [Opitutaceae bacterium]